MTMNCSRFRYFLQQKIDQDLQPQDERMVKSHLDTCDSCTRFNHQLEQVCQAALEVALPDECLPASIEALAGKIMQSMPNEKGGFLSTVKNIFASTPKIPKPPSSPKAAGGSAAGAPSGSHSSFPHVARPEPAPSEAPPTKGKKVIEQADELLATSTRLKSLSKIQHDVDQPTTTEGGGSLAKKM